MPYVTNLLMVFGWGKKKDEKQTMEAAPSEKEIHLSDVKNIIDEITSLREKTLIEESKYFQNKISYQLYELVKIAKKLERDDLNTDDIDRHLKMLVLRGKTQVIDTIKKEADTQFSDLKTIDDVLNFDKKSSQILKKIGDVLGRQTRVIHIFAKKYANKLKFILSNQKSDLDEIKTMLGNYTKMKDNITDVLDDLNKISSLKKLQETSGTKLEQLQGSINAIDKKTEQIEQDIDKLKSSNEYAKFLEIKKQIVNLDSEKRQITHEIDLQFTKISRPLSKYSYITSLEKHQKQLMGKLIDRPFAVLSAENKTDIITILQAARKNVLSSSISVKDPDKTIAQIDETTEMLDSFISKVSEFNTTKGKLEDSLSVFSVKDLNQKESELSKLSDDKQNLESKTHTLEEDISNSKKEVPNVVIDIEMKLKVISSSKYRIV